MPTANQIEPLRNATAKHAIAERLSELSFVPVTMDIEIAKKQATRLPFDSLASLGVGFASIPEAFRTVTQTIETGAGEPLYRAIVPEGATLRQAKDALFSSSAKYSDGTAAWAKYQQVDTVTQNVTTSLPYDPTALAMAVALAQVNQKLDSIQDTLDDIFDYLRVKDKADILASLETLASIFNDYKFNWDNEQFRQAKYELVLSINQNALRHIKELRAHLSKKMERKGVLEFRGKAESDADELLDLLKDYQLAVYLYSFSVFLGVMLLENYEPAYLESKADDVRSKALEYRELYTACFDAIESRNKGSVDSFVLGGLSAGIKGLGNAIARTPIGDVTPIDEALVGAGCGIGGFDERENARIARRLTQAKDPATGPFAEGIDSINRVYNRPSQLLTDGSALYVVFEED